MVNKKTTFQFASDPQLIKASFREVMASLSDLKFEEDEIYNLKLCFTEAFVNAVKHGNKFDPKLTVDVEVIRSDDAIEIAVKDQGKGYDYKNLEDCTQEKNLTKDGGRGVFLIQKLMDGVTFENNGACIRMVKRLKN